MNEDLQQKYMELQMMNSHIKQSQKQLKDGVRQTVELQKIKDNFEELKKIEEDTEIMASLAPGIFVKANIKSPQKILLGVGDGVVVEKHVDDGKKLLDQQIDGLNKMIDELKKEIQENIFKFQKLQQEVQFLAAKSK